MHEDSLPLLDNIESMKELDSTDSLASIEQIGNQIQEVWELSKEIVVPAEYSKLIQSNTPMQIVVCGMGGSILGTDIIQSVFADMLPGPITIVPDYSVPAFVGKNTLVIAASYSGSTEETWSAVQEAKEKGALIAGVTGGGKIGDFLKENNYPHLIFSGEFNPCGIAKMGIGYSIFGQIMLFSALGLLAISESDFKTVLDSIARAHLQMSASVSQQANIAKLLAFQLIDHLPMVMSAEHLAGATHVFVNQLNENAKSFAEYHILPELNHHLLEALSYPSTIKHNISWISLQSDLYKKENRNRQSLTETALEDQNLSVTPYQLKETTKLGQVFEVIMLGTYTSFYLAMLHSVDPGPVPTVDWFKAELKKMS